MSELGDIFKALKKDRQREGEHNRCVAEQQFNHAASIASEHGFVFARHSDAHYSIRPPDGRWLINFYPGNGRIYGDRNKRESAPYITIDTEDRPTLLEFVTAVVGKGTG